MQLILFRHGPAGRADPARWPDDGQRPLSARGGEKTRAAALGLARVVNKGATVWTSPLVRARQTADLIATALGAATPTTFGALAPGGPERTVLARLGAPDVDGPVVLVGHEPDLGRLAGSLLAAGPSSLPLKKAGAVVLDFDGSPRRGEGRLAAFLPPRVLRALGARRAARRKTP